MSTRYVGQPLTTWRGVVDATGFVPSATALTGQLYNAGTSAAPIAFTLATGGQYAFKIYTTGSNTSGRNYGFYLSSVAAGIGGELTAFAADASTAAATTGCGMLRAGRFEATVGAAAYSAGFLVGASVGVYGSSDSTIAHAFPLWVDAGITWSTVSGYNTMIYISNNGTGLVNSIFQIWGGATYLFHFRAVESGSDAWRLVGTSSTESGALKIIIGTTVRYIQLYTTQTT